MKSFFSVVLARDAKSGGIGVNNRIPWNIPEDMKEFKSITTRDYLSSVSNIVIMGKNTWNSLPAPLPNRTNIVVSSELHNKLLCCANVYTCRSLDRALERAYSLNKDANVFVIGGERLYRESFAHEKLESIYLTSVHPKSTIMYDVCFNDQIPRDFSIEYHKEEISSGDECILHFEKWVRKVSSDEDKYLGLLRDVLTNGEERIDRTGVGTISTFGNQIEFDISTRFPLLTSKRVTLRVVFEELMWFLRGQTSNNILNEKRVHIWDGNSSSDYMTRIGLGHYPKGELGPVYGAQWRNFGGQHDMEKVRHIEDGGVDQIKEAINLLRTDPTSRRILVSAWNPNVLDKVALPPCHYSFQFYTRKGEWLDIKLNMRSNDLFLGAPFNIASYSLLCYMVAAMTGYKPGKLVYSVGDAHIYKNHIDQVKEQLSRPLRPFPTLKLLRIPENIEDFEFDDVELSDYFPHKVIRGQMAV